MWPLFVVVPHPTIDDGPRLTQRFEAVEPDTLLLQGLKEAFHEPIPLWRIWRRELLRQAAFTVPV